MPPDLQSCLIPLNLRYWLYFTNRSYTLKTELHRSNEDLNMPSDNFSDIMNGPAMAPPLGQTFISPTNRSEEQKWYYVSASLTISIAGLFIAVRMYTRVQIVRKKDLSDGRLLDPYYAPLLTLYQAPQSWLMYRDPNQNPVFEF